MVNDTWFKSLATHQVKGFILDTYVGKGRIGYVYKAHSKGMPEWKVAIKLIPGSPRAGWDNEIRKASLLSNIHGVVQFHGLDTDRIDHDGVSELFMFTVWDYVHPGRNLKQYLRENGTCSTSFLVAVFEQILRVLHACEKRGVSRHGDLHSGNILIGDKDEADLDSSLRTREPVFVSDFGYGTTGGAKTPKDDYVGLAGIVDEMVGVVEWDAATTTDRQMLQELRRLIDKLLREQTVCERRPPLEILKSVQDLARKIRAYERSNMPPHFTEGGQGELPLAHSGMSVGQFQISEMLGDDWEWWKKLFVSAVPAKSRILEPDTPTVVTGPRGCGKTMLFRRLSERLLVECGPVDAHVGSPNFVGFYVNANDIADAFSSFDQGKIKDERLICYANLCILSDFLAVLSARSAKVNDEVDPSLLDTLREWLVGEHETSSLLVGENPLEHYRSKLEKIKWDFPNSNSNRNFPGYADFARHIWLPHFISMVRRYCGWISSKTVFIFFDDYTTPRISEPMQKALNRLLFQRSSEFVSKIATESATTFIPEDSSGKTLQDGDDYQLIDMGEESLFMSDEERAWFLNEVFARRLSLDPRIPQEGRQLEGLLSHLSVKKTEFARRLRKDVEGVREKDNVTAGSQRRGATRPKVLYHGAEVFTALWSGDTRTMIQVVQELVDEATPPATAKTTIAINSELQDRVFRNRGGQWLEAQARNQPTNRASVQREIETIRAMQPGYNLTGGSYGGHLKAVVEAFVKIARQLLLGPMYKIQEGNTIREVPRTAFRIEVTDEFRVDGLAAEIYKDLIRYGMFMRDARGKSVRGAFVPRLYLRRLLLPFSTLALSKRDSIQMNCDWFIKLLLTPDSFQSQFTRYLPKESSPDQISLTFSNDDPRIDPRYDDTDEEGSSHENG